MNNTKEMIDGIISICQSRRKEMDNNNIDGILYDRIIEIARQIDNSVKYKVPVWHRYDLEKPPYDGECVCIIRNYGGNYICQSRWYGDHFDMEYQDEYHEILEWMYMPNQELKNTTV